MRSYRVSLALLGVLFLGIPTLTYALFDQNLRYTDRGTAVTELQQFLIERGLLEKGSATGYFGKLTLKAVQNFQTLKGITPVSGFFGPLTRTAAHATAPTPTYPADTRPAANCVEFRTDHFSGWKCPTPPPLTRPCVPYEAPELCGAGMKTTTDTYDWSGCFVPTCVSQ